MIMFLTQCIQITYLWANKASKILDQNHHLQILIYSFLNDVAIVYYYIPHSENMVSERFKPQQNKKNFTYIKSEDYR